VLLVAVNFADRYSLDRLTVVKTPAP
jgi:hypothetical protein